MTTVDCLEFTEKTQMSRTDTQHNHDSPLLSPADVARILRVCKRTVQRYIASGVLPPPIRLSPQIYRWPRKAIEEAFGLAAKKSADLE